MRRRPFLSYARRALLVALCSPPLVCLAAEQPAKSVASDRIVLPPARREFRSADRTFLLVVETADEWKSPYPSARLYRTGPGQPVLRWTRMLTQQYGPRDAIVSGDGHVLFVDEWINVTSRWALLLIDVDNRVVVTHDHKAVVDALAAPQAEIAAHARRGTWITDGPTLSPDGRSARIAAGGRMLVVSFQDGRLSVTR